MGIAAGTRLGPYEIQSPLGAGGMGEVYRARDTRLGREVAVKVLPGSFAADADRLRRFEQEARAVAALNHPNILAVYDVGAQDTIPYLVTELLEGESLRGRIGPDGVAPRRATEIAQQIAVGLAAAHDRGVVHRDLKPENIFITRDGRVKILDFGLARQMSLAAAQGGEATLGTVTPHTEAGVMLGTIGYMAPEQVKGQAADARSDIFAFGTILYEMLSGRRAFKRDTPVETASAILKEEPPELVSSTERMIPPALDRIVRRCLEKDPRERLQSAKDLAFALESVSAAPVSGIEAAAPEPTGRSSNRKRFLVMLAAVTVVLAFTGLAAYRAGRNNAATLPNRVVRLTFRDGYIRSARFAPDGHSVIYSAMWDGAPFQLFTGRTDSPEALKLDVPSADLLAVSRDGQVAISTNRRFNEPWVPVGQGAVVSLLGGAPRTILDSVLDADWSPDGSGLAVAYPQRNRFYLDTPAGKHLYETDGFVSHVRFAPDGKLLAFVDHPIYGDDRGMVVIMDPATGKRITVGPEYDSLQGMAWHPATGELWYGHKTSLFAIGAAAKPRLVWRSLAGNMRLQDIAADGRLLLTDDTIGGDIIAGTIGGPESRSLVPVRWATLCGLSANGDAVLMDEFSVSNEYQVYLRKTDGSPAVELGSGSALDITPDGSAVLVYVPERQNELILIPTGAGAPKKFAFGIRFQDEAAFFPDGKRVLLNGNEAGHAARAYVFDVSSGAPPRAVTAEGVLGILTSPDGSSIAAKDHGSRLVIYPLNGGQPRVLSTDPLDQPVQWLNDGTILVHHKDEIPLNVYSIDVRSGARKVWHTFRPANLTGVITFRNIRVTRDGKRYVYETRRVLSTLYVVTGLN